MIDFSKPNYGVDIADGLKMLGGNSKIYARLLQTYQSGDLYEKFVQAVQSGDIEAMRVAAHTLKGATGNLHLTPLFEKSKDIESKIKDSGAAPSDEDLNELEQIQDLTVHTILNLLQDPEQLDAFK